MVDECDACEPDDSSSADSSPPTLPRRGHKSAERRGIRNACASAKNETTTEDPADDGFVKSLLRRWENYRAERRWKNRGRALRSNGIGAMGRESGPDEQ